MTTRRRDQGSATVFAAVLAPALLLVTALFINAATRWNAWRDANAAAAAAARAAVQVSDSEFLPTDHSLRLDPGLARSRALLVLSQLGYEGTVTLTGNRTVTVVVSAPVHYALPGSPFGSTVEGSSVADVASGIGGAP